MEDSVTSDTLYLKERLRSSKPFFLIHSLEKEFLAIVYEARGMKGRKVVGVAPWMMKMGMGKVVKDYAARGVDSGMDPLYLPYIMDLNIFTEQTDCRELGVTDDDIRAAIFDSIKVSEDAYNGKVKLLEMKGE